MRTVRPIGAGSTLQHTFPIVKNKQIGPNGPGAEWRSLSKPFSEKRILVTSKEEI